MDMLLESQIYWRLIALAQSVPHCEQTLLFDWIARTLDGPLSTNQMEKLTQEQLQATQPAELLAGQAAFTDAEWLAMLNCLHGQLPSHLNPIPARPDPDALLVAFCSNDGVHINGHFGTCQLFFIYQVASDKAQLIDIRNFVEHETLEDNEIRAQLLDGCHLLFCEAIGGPAAARIIRHNIHPLKIKKKDNAIAMQLQALHVLMNGTLPPWLAKVLGRNSGLQQRFMDELLE